MRSHPPPVRRLGCSHLFRPAGKAVPASSQEELHSLPTRPRWPARENKAMRRVVVTGLGVVAPNGIGKEAFWSACLEGRSGVGPIRSFDASGHPVKIAAEVERPELKIQRSGQLVGQLAEEA